MFQYKSFDLWVVRAWRTVPLLVALMMGACQSENTIRLDEMDITAMTTGWGKPVMNQTVLRKPLTVADVTYKNGVGTHAVSTFLLDLNRKGKILSGKVGVDDEATDKASVEFMLLGDRKILWESGTIHRGDSAASFNVSLRGIQQLGLLVTDAGDGINYDHADWLDVQLTFRGLPPSASVRVAEEPYLLTPPAPPTPRINGPKVYGIRPGSPFLYRIPCTGERPVHFEADNLPEGLSLQTETGIITGSVTQRGTYLATLKAKNSRGSTQREFRIVVGDTLMLTPSMGWNSWYIHYNRVSDSIMRNAADQMIATGMADYGYQYVNIDDCWMVKANSDDPVIGGAMRDKTGRLLTNKRFPDMAKMTDYIHSKGLKAGIYISPGPTTCAGYAGSYQHEAQDARTFAEWGFDFLKYDWCSYGRIAPDRSRKSLMAPYKLMWSELQKQNRDIVLNLCQYGMGKVWEWGGQVGNSWRTTGDLGLSSGSSMPGFYYIGRSNADHWPYARPGNWNDPDYILIGWVGSAHIMGEGVKTTLTPSEQYFYMSMWSLMASPLIFSGDMGKLDDFTLNVLCNNEVIDINQDPLGKQARIIREENDEMVMVKDLEDGSLAVGLFHVTTNPDDPSGYFNWGEDQNLVTLTVTAEELGFSDRIMHLRDVWRQKDLGAFTGSYSVQVPYHGVQLLVVK
ncbi:MAG: NPCBM/NEW2 domain-containing protein, partial [Bacteroidales bacterium]|nr:NPCBM/NEW2 domain-containing protein [Bacteroidales bacterium]